jgi:hypothetical protein
MSECRYKDDMGGITRVIFTSCQSLEVPLGCASGGETRRRLRADPYICSYSVLQALLLDRCLLAEGIDSVNEVSENLFWVDSV